MRTTFALSVSQVSRYWREVAMQTPFLWSGIRLFPWRTQGGYYRFLQILLERSQGHPLDIALTLLDYDNPNSESKRMKAVFDFLSTRQNSDPIPPKFTISRHEPIPDHCLRVQLGMFIPEVSRWKNFRYECSDSTDVSQIMKPLANLSAPILESFHLLTSRRDGGLSEPRNIFGGGAPKLSLIHIRGIT
jgi:hypothetical protein